MKWHLLRMFWREVARGRGTAARQELVALKTYRAMIDVARSKGGQLIETPPEQKARDRLLSIERRWYGPAIQKTGPRTGITDVLSFLATRNVLLVVISDYEAQYKLEALGLDGRFASVYVGERLAFLKPSPKVFQRVAADFQIPAVSILHIGDRVERDEAAALAAGCQCLILGRDFRSFDDLLEKLRPLIL